MAKLVFVTGTDTGSGKSVLTALLVASLRAGGHEALAMKPFCSGSWDDVDLLATAQDYRLDRNRICPFHFKQPLAPWVAARLTGRKVRLAEVIDSIHNVAHHCEILLIEGVGGLRVPLGEGYSVLSLIKTLDCPAIIVARNELGAISHTLLTLDALRHGQCQPGCVVLMQPSRRSQVTRTNVEAIAELVAPVPLQTLPYLGQNPCNKQRLKKNAQELKKTLARILEVSIFTTTSDAVRK